MKWKYLLLQHWLYGTYHGHEALKIPIKQSFSEVLAVLCAGMTHSLFFHDFLGFQVSAGTVKV